MPRERDPPYVAAGFRNDAQKVLEKFVAKKTIQFAEFAAVWREGGLSMIYMGRENLRELTELIEECYRNTILFMDASNAFQKVGAVYMLYSLYLKQPPLLMKTPMVIPFTVKQIYELYELENHFMDIENEEGFLDLAFIVAKLFKMEAIRASSSPIPMGPATPIPLLKLEPLRKSDFKEILSALSMLNEREIKGIADLTKKYEDLKKKLPFVVCSPCNITNFNKYSELKETISELEDRYNAGLLPYKGAGDIKIEDEFKSLGERRAMLKSQQYGKKAEVGLSRRTRASSDSSPSPVKRGPGRPRKKTGKRGRKKKVVEVQIKSETDSTDRDDDGAAAPAHADTSAAAADDDLIAEVIDNPESSTAGKLSSPKRPTKNPRPIRKHYFEDSD